MIDVFYILKNVFPVKLKNIANIVSLYSTLIVFLLILVRFSLVINVYAGDGLKINKNRVLEVGLDCKNCSGLSGVNIPPVLCGNCNSGFCFECFFSKAQGVCPVCQYDLAGERADVTAQKHAYQLDLEWMTRLKGITVYCPYEGCSWSGMYDSTERLWQRHNEKCSYKTKPKKSNRSGEILSLGSSDSDSNESTDSEFSGQLACRELRLFGKTEISLEEMEGLLQLLADSISANDFGGIQAKFSEQYEGGFNLTFGSLPELYGRDVSEKTLSINIDNVSNQRLVSSDLIIDVDFLSIVMGGGIKETARELPVNECFFLYITPSTRDPNGFSVAVFVESHSTKKEEDVFSGNTFRESAPREVNVKILQQNVNYIDESEISNFTETPQKHLHTHLSSSVNDIDRSSDVFSKSKLREEKVGTLPEDSQSNKDQTGKMLRTISNETILREHLSCPDFCLCSVVSQEDFFLYALKKQEKGLVKVNDCVITVIPDSRLKSGEIVLNSTEKGLLEASELRLSRLEKTPEEVKEAAIFLRLTNPASHTGCLSVDESELLKRSTKGALKHAALLQGKSYPLFVMAKQGQATGEVSEIWCRLTVQIACTGKPGNTENYFMLSEDCETCFLSTGDDILSINTPGTASNQDEQEVFTVKKLVKYNGDNRVGMSLSSLLKRCPVETDDGYVPLVKINGHFYFAKPYQAQGSDGSVLQTSLSFPWDASSKVCIDTKVQPQLPAAICCQIKLNWTNNEKKYLEITNAELETSIRKALKYVPLKKGKVFDVMISQNNGRQLLLVGTVISVKGRTEHHSDRPLSFLADVCTGVNIDARNVLRSQVSTAGSEGNQVQDRFTDRICQRVAGAEDKARYIMRELIEPYQLFAAGKTQDYQKGIILYGPPGTGKSLLAQNLLGLLSEELGVEVSQISASQLIGDSAGKTIKNLSQCFQPALNDLQDTGSSTVKLHVLYFDEFDSIIALQDRSESNPMYSHLETVTKYLQHLLSGYEPPLNNIMVIATTNKTPSHHFPPELLRSSRMKLAVNCGLPDCEQREKILQMHFDKQDKSIYSFEQLNIDDCAKLTSGKSGADLELLVTTATSTAYQRALLSGDHQEGSEVQITKADFEQALYKPERIQREQKAALKKLSLLTQPIYLSSDSGSLKTAVQKLDFSQLRPGRSGVITIHGEDSGRRTILCRNLLEACKGYDHYTVVNQKGRMIDDAESAIRCMAYYNKSVVVIDSIDQVIREETGRTKAVNVGHAWQRFINAYGKDKNAMLILTTRTPSDERYCKCIEHMTELPLPRLKIELPSTLREGDMKEILKTQCPGATQQSITAVVKIFRGRCRTDTFVDLVKYYCINDTGECWDTEQMAIDYEQRQDFDQEEEWMSLYN